MITKIPDPEYDYDVDILVRAYKKAVSAIISELSRLDLSDMSRANSRATLAEVTKLLGGLNEESAAWVEKYISKAATDGVVRTLVSLSIAPTVAEAEKVVKFNRINREMVASAIDDTQSDVLAVTQNVERRVRTAVRQATAESFRANMAKGVNGRRTISRDILDGMKKRLGDAVNTGIIDSAGRRWQPHVYAEMVTRTKMLAAHRESTINEAVGRGAYYARISRHGATDDCRLWEGRIIKLIPEAPGDYPFVGDLPRKQIFHVCCKHVLSPFRTPELASQ